MSENDIIRDFVFKYYNEQEKGAIKELLKWEKSLLHITASTLNSELHQTFLTSIRAQAMTIQDGVTRRILAAINDEILDILRKENDLKDGGKE